MNRDYLPYYLENNGLTFKKYLVQMQTPLIIIFFDDSLV